MRDDTITLPCIIKTDLSKFGQYTKSPAWFYQIVFRELDGTIKVLDVGFDEEKAKRRLEDIKNDITATGGK